METLEVPRKLWEHPNPESTLMYKFMQELNRKHELQLKTFWDLFDFSINRRSAFWGSLLDFSGLIYEGSCDRVVDEDATIDSVPKWFEGVRLNFAENMLYSRSSGGAAEGPGSRGTRHKEDAKIAVTEVREAGSSVQHVSWAELRRRAGQLAAAMAARGVRRGDRVVVVGANSVETLLVWLATTWLGGMFSSSSTDMGVKGILQRTVQVDPAWLFMDDAAVYNGKDTDLRDKMAGAAAGLREGCPSFRGVVVVPRFDGRVRSGTVEAVAAALNGGNGGGGGGGSGSQAAAAAVTAMTWDDYLAVAGPAEKVSPPPFARIPFGDPFLICYSSGTTGTPKAIVHTVGGCMLNYYKEAALHEELGPDSVTLQFTTVGWIMYVANVGTLLLGARAVMYDGSPFQPDASMLVRLVADQKVTKLGTSPRWMTELVRAGIAPRDVADMSSLKVVTSTGMVLSDQLQHWFYDNAFPSHVHLGNLSGGTDIAGSFGCLNPLTPVYVGGAQGPSLAVDVRIYDAMAPDGPGREVPNGTAGELVAVRAFPNTPCFLWNDTGPAGRPGSRYHSAYFARFDRVWAHGDFCMVHPTTRNIYFLGRADGVLNPGGVRFGSAEIYSVLERRFADRVADSLCVGQRRPTDQDETVLLFLFMRPGCSFSNALVRQIKEAIASDLSKRHVPKYVFETPEIPTTINLKKVELPVKQIVSGQKIKPSGTLANPQSLDYFYQFVEVEKLAATKEKL